MTIKPDKPRMHFTLRRRKPGEKPFFTKQQAEAMVKIAKRQLAEERKNGSEHPA